jgi:hypothetical protein
MKKVWTFAIALTSTIALLMSIVGTSPAMASTHSYRSTSTKLFCYAYGDAYCIWSQTAVKFLASNSVANLNDYGFANVDATVENAAPPYAVYLRLYWGTNYSGAWVCINPGVYIANTANYTFNNGKGRSGYGQTLYRNVASAGFNTSPCTNPIG